MARTEVSPIAMVFSVVQEALGVALVLKSDAKVSAYRTMIMSPVALPPAPARDPEVEGVVQVDVGKHR